MDNTAHERAGHGGLQSEPSRITVKPSMSIRKDFHLPLEFFELGRSVVKMCNPFRLSRK